MTRRSFLKWALGLLSVLAGARIRPILSAQGPDALADSTYGSGAYGEATYGSYSLYLPLVRGG